MYSAHVHEYVIYGIGSLLQLLPIFTDVLVAMDAWIHVKNMLKL